jgi:hypothetical protein
MKTITRKITLLAGEAALLLAICLLLAAIAGNLVIPAQAAAYKTGGDTLPGVIAPGLLYNPKVIGTLTSQISLIPISFTVDLPIIVR